jgi:hypothetical protein
MPHDSADWAQRKAARLWACREGHAIARGGRVDALSLTRQLLRPRSEPTHGRGFRARANRPLVLWLVVLSHRYEVTDLLHSAITHDAKVPDDLREAKERSGRN